MNTGRWENAAAFKRWADHILELAQQTPDDPIPECVVCLSPDQRKRPLTAGERVWAEGELARIDMGGLRG